MFLADSDMAGVSVKIDGERERQRLGEMINVFRAEFGGGYISAPPRKARSPGRCGRTCSFCNACGVRSGSGSRRPAALRPCTRICPDPASAARFRRRQCREDARRFARNPPADAGVRRQVRAGDGAAPEHYPGERPIFELYGIEDEIQRALSKKVPLKSGGYLIVDQTEAMTTIDVNTGAYVGHRNLEETIFKTNLEAASAIARQIAAAQSGRDHHPRLHRHGQRGAPSGGVQGAGETSGKDRAKSHISQVSPLGLVEMTRKRTRESLEQVLCEPCPLCNGRGSIKTAETVCYDIFRELLREARQYSPRQFMVLARRMWWTPCSTRNPPAWRNWKPLSVFPSNSRRKPLTPASSMTWC